MIDLAHMQKEVIELTTEVASFIRQEVANFDKSKIEHKDTANNLVSYVDKEAEKKIVVALKKILPGSGFLAEEGTSSEGSNEYRWIIDPLDGTTNFTHGLPPYAISIGLARADKMVLGVVHEVSRSECFHAIENEDAYCNGERIKVANTSSLNESLLATGFPYYHFDKREEYLSIINYK